MLKLQLTGEGKMNKYDLDGRHAVVTGGAQGIGLAITERLVQSGATVSIWDVDQDRAAQVAFLHGGQVQARQVDVTSYESVSRAAQAEDAIDILVNNAGIAGPNMPLADYPLEDWKQVMDINMNGVFHCLKAVTPRMIEAGYGRIINIASIAGKEGNPNASAYSTSKAAVIAMTKSLGKELAGYDIAVNCVTPAAARTAIFDQMSEEHINYMLSKIPRNRFVLVEEVASLVGYLASADNSFTTGGVFDISGGRATY
jgi:NAD(P)-dependent dehydrogenase (short-subunit alcohol dehydrogenase family)